MIASDRNPPQNTLKMKGEFPGPRNQRKVYIVVRRKVGGTNISSLFSTRRRRGLEKITAQLFLATELGLRLPNDVLVKTLLAVTMKNPT